MTHDLAYQRFHSYEEAKNWIDSWIASKDMSFFRRKIHILAERWEKVVSNDGQYFNSNAFVSYILNKLYFVKKQRELIQGPINCGLTLVFMTGKHHHCLYKYQCVKKHSDITLSQE